MKKRTLKRIASFTLSSMMIVSLLSGCGGGKQAESQPAAGEATTAQTKGEEKEEPYVVTMLTQGEQQEDLPRIMEKVNEILVRDLNMKLNLLVAPYGSINQQRQLMLTSGEPLDLVYLDASSAIGFMNNGQIIDLSDLIDKYGTNIKKYWEDEA